MKRRILMILLAAALCAGIGYCAPRLMFRKVYTNVPETSKPQYFMEIQRDDETGVDYVILLDKNKNPVDMELRVDAKGNPFVTSEFTSK